MLHYLDYTADAPAANIAVDEALLDWVEESATTTPREVLRVWAPTSPFAVIGRASSLQQEVNEAVCRERAVPILRRGSGGTAIVTGPGCLMYAVVLSLTYRPQLRMIDAAHQFVLERVAAAIRRCGVPAQLAGTSDVMVEGRKCSGNSMRMRRDALLYHGTLLLDLDLSLMECLSHDPPRQPEYRAGRSHGDFLVNLRLPAERVKAALREEWEAREELADWPKSRVEQLVEERFGRSEWIYQR